MGRDHISNLRKDYNKHSLVRADLAGDPTAQFDAWFEQALIAEGELEANVMALATADSDGNPSVRMVLLKGILDGTFVFFTNYLSRKGAEIMANPRASLVFWWRHLQRQVRIEGSVSKVPVPYSRAYFESRPAGSQMSAIVSPQSEVIANRKDLSERLKKLEKQAEGGKPIEKPTHWGGYGILPDMVEFWQGRENRLHDRFRYTRSGTIWKIERLAP
ncbi:MAG: pyridoxamine 5'-phosphate oxidase [Saprospiraceae bacterium]|nr:pyridoxamine 5'-phosphate oxidase [Saprospiraceae bacterium]